MLRLGKLECSGGFLLAAALLFYMDPGDLIPLAALAAGFHELGHWTAVRLMGGEVRVLRLTVTGGNMELDHRRPLTYGGACRHSGWTGRQPAPGAALRPAGRGAGGALCTLRPQFGAGVVQSAANLSAGRWQGTAADPFRLYHTWPGAAGSMGLFGDPGRTVAGGRHEPSLARGTQSDATRHGALAFVRTDTAGRGAHSGQKIDLLFHFFCGIISWSQ